MTAYNIKEPNAPASDKQRDFIASLLKDLPEGHQMVTRFEIVKATGGGLTKARASAFIDKLLPVVKEHKAAAKIAKHAPVVSAYSTAVPASAGTHAVLAPVAPTPVQELPMPEHGYYYVAKNINGSPSVQSVFYFFGPVKTKYGTQVKFQRLTKNWNGNYTWKYAGSVYAAKKVLAGETVLSQEKAGMLGKQYGICIRCGRTLTDPVSVANGLGPICQKYWA